MRPVFTNWHKSTASLESNCVEVATDGEFVGVRDSKNPDGPVLTFTGGEWKAFLKGAENGEFNGPEA